MQTVCHSSWKRAWMSERNSMRTRMIGNDANYYSVMSLSEHCFLPRLSGEINVWNWNLGYRGGGNKILAARQ